jgi:Major tropism determinant N-terminal domain
MSVQVQLRRDTLANVLANHGAQGEVFIGTDTNELFIQDGATNGGFRASGVRGPFGSFAQPALAESAGAEGETLTTGVTAYTSTAQLPAGYKFIMGAGWRVETTITGITTIDFGVTGSATLFAAVQSPSLTAGSTVIYGQNQVRYDAAPVSLLLTSHAGTNFTAGAIRFVVQYILLSPPTS